MNFKQEYPRYCFVFTELHPLEINGVWLRRLVLDVLARQYDLSDEARMEALLSDMERKGFAFEAVGGVPAHALRTGQVNAPIRVPNSQFRSVTYPIVDPTSRTGMVRINFYFDRYHPLRAARVEELSAAKPPPMPHELGAPDQAAQPEPSWAAPEVGQPGPGFGAADSASGAPGGFVTEPEASPLSLKVIGLVVAWVAFQIVPATLFVLLQVLVGIPVLNSGVIGSVVDYLIDLLV